MYYMVNTTIILLSLSLASVQGPQGPESSSFTYPTKGQIPHDFEQITFPLSQSQFLICKLGIIVAYLFHKDFLR